MRRVVALFGLVIALYGCDSEQTRFVPTEEEQEIGNPYVEGTGHYAGYEWAERTGGACEGNSNSFNEGCEEYYQQTNE